MLFKPILTLFAVALAAAAPVSARREAGTIPLLTTIENKGVTVRYDPPECTSDYRGMYFPMRHEMWLCTGMAQRKSHDDHDTVRHEAWHLLQHCRHGGPHLKTFYTDRAVFTDLVNQHVSVSIYRFYSRLYTGAHRLVELEAHAASKAFTSAQIDQLIQRYC